MNGLQVLGCCLAVFCGLVLSIRWLDRRSFVKCFGVPYPGNSTQRDQIREGVVAKLIQRKVKVINQQRVCNGQKKNFDDHARTTPHDVSRLIEMRKQIDHIWFELQDAEDGLNEALQSARSAGFNEECIVIEAD